MADTAPKPDAKPSNDLIAKFATWEKRFSAKRNKWIKEAKECFDLRDGDQWGLDGKMKETLDDAGRITPTFNLIGPLLDAVSGAEIMNRQQVQYFPRQVGKAAMAEVLTHGAEWIRDRCDADMEESEAFRDSFTCGEGWTETLIDYEEDQQGKIGIDRVDPLEMAVDPSSRKANYADARYLRRSKPYSHDEFEERWPDAIAAVGGVWDTFSVNDPRYRYEGDDDTGSDHLEEDEVLVHEWQWYELVDVHVVAHPDDPAQTVELSREDFEKGMEEANSLPPGPEAEQAKAFFTNAVTLKRRVYYRAFQCGEQILNAPNDRNGNEQGEADTLDKGEFTYKCMTGKRDRNKGVWYGLVRPMRDPQRWANQFLAQLLGILAVAAKGGLLAEVDAVEDTKQFEADYAKIGGISWTAPGAIERGAIKEKPQAAIPQSVVQMMEFAFSSLNSTTGINPEMLGMVDREQAGVLEDQRKRAAYGLLSVFFDSFRRYRRMQGRLQLKFMAHLPPEYLVQIQGTEDMLSLLPPEVLQTLPKNPTTGQPQINGQMLNVQLGLAGDFKDVEKFNIIVDDAPAGPNQKAQAWGVIVQLMPYLMKANLPPDFWSKVAEYSPLPAALAQKMSQFLAQAGPTPMQEAGEAAKVAKDQGAAAKDAAAAIDSLANAARNRAAAGVMEPGDQSSFGQPELRIDQPSPPGNGLPAPPIGDSTQ